MLRFECETLEQRKYITPAALKVFILLMDWGRIDLQDRWSFIGDPAPFNLDYFDERTARQLILTKEQLLRICVLIQTANACGGSKPLPVQLLS
jgi:hypothetical protein